jgi:nicotinamidase-related amidase
LTQLRDVADEIGVVANAARLAARARDVGVRVVHCCATFRADLAGSTANNRLLAMSHRLNGEAMAQHEPGAELVGELGSDENDIVVSRLHGLTPFTSTSLDQILRNEKIQTIVAVGCSLNIGVMGLVLSAADLGYQVVVVSDAVAGVPRSYGDAMLEHSMPMVATIASTDEVLSAWS